MSAARRRLRPVARYGLGEFTKAPYAFILYDFEIRQYLTNPLCPLEVVSTLLMRQSLTNPLCPLEAVSTLVIRQCLTNPLCPLETVSTLLIRQSLTNPLCPLEIVSTFTNASVPY